MYKVIHAKEGGFQVCWQEYDGAPLRPVRVQPYKHRQSAHRKAKQLNDAIKLTDEMIAKDGAIII